MQTEMSLTMPIAAGLLSHCVEEPSTLLNLLTAEQMTGLKDFIFDHLEDKDGAPEIGNLDLTFFNYEPEEQSGSFRIHFYINRRFCCSEVESSRPDYVDFQFSYTKETLYATAHYFDWNVT